MLCPGLVTVDISSSHFILIWGDHGGVTGLSRLRGVKEKFPLSISHVQFPGWGRSTWRVCTENVFLALCYLSHSERLRGHCGLGIGSSFWAPTLAHIAFCFEWNQEILLNTKNIQDLYPSTAIHCNKEGFNKHLLNSNYVPSTVLNAEVITNKGVWDVILIHMKFTMYYSWRNKRSQHTHVDNSQDSVSGNTHCQMIAIHFIQVLSRQGHI